MYAVSKAVQGGEDVRLVDADKQLEWVDCMKPIHGIGLEPVVAVETVHDLIKGAPTIDAIPVEWIEDMLREWHKNKAPFEALGAVSVMLVRWQKEQKEQEAQDG